MEIISDYTHKLDCKTSSLFFDFDLHRVLPGIFFLTNRGHVSKGNIREAQSEILKQQWSEN